MTKKNLIIITALSVFIIGTATAIGGYLTLDDNNLPGVKSTNYIATTVVKTFSLDENILPFVDRETNDLYIPLRQIVENIDGCTIDVLENYEGFSISYNGNVLIIKENEKHATINNYSILLKNAPKKIEDTMFISSSFFENNFNVNVLWDRTNNISLEFKSIETPVVSTNVFSYNDKNIYYYVEAPVVTSIHDVHFAEEINQAIVSNKTKQIAEFVSTLNSTIISEATLTNWTSKINKAYVNNDIISIYWLNQQKSANENTLEFIETFNIDLVNQKIMILDDLFIDSSYKTNLLKIVNAIIESKFGKKLDSIEGNEVFYLEDNKLNIYLGNNELGKISIVEVPLKEISKYIKKDFTFYVSTLEK